MLLFKILSWVTLASASSVSQFDLTHELIAKVSERLAEGSQLSWELGTRAQAILELNATSFSVLSWNHLPPSTVVPASLSDSLEPFFDIARDVVQNRSTSNNYTIGPQPLMKDGSAADPASIGFAVLLANWTGIDPSLNFGAVAKDQLDFLLEHVPRTEDGAISHRTEQVQLWSDFVFMVPPFIAYYGALTHNQTLLLEAYKQIKLYRKYLRDDKANGLWMHVVLGSHGFNDEGHWSTGNGWAAAGMLRVLATIQNSEFAGLMQNEQEDLINWIDEIQTAMYNVLDTSTLVFTNYASLSSVSPGNFYDTASTALLAATTFRISIHSSPPFSNITPPIRHNLPWAEKSRDALGAPGPNGTLVYFDEEGWVGPVVNPHSFGEKGSKSAEAQAFVVMMQAAWRDWKSNEERVQAGALGLKGGMGARIWLISLLGGILLLL